jgi:hypothetical protein
MNTKIIHLHLPKTAGTSINRWLDLLAPAGRVRPADYDERFFIRRTATTAWAYPFPEATPEALYDDLGRESRAYWDIIHGHAHSLVTRHPSAYRFVILRDPTSRLLSLLRDWRRLEPSAVERLAGPAGDVRRDALTCTANEFLERHARAPHFRLLSQAHTLREAAAPLPETALRSAQGGDLTVARRALDELFDYVGVFEDLAGAVRCVARDIGAAPPADVPQANAGRRDPARDELSPAALALLRESWADDYALHEHAGRLARGFAAPGYDEAAFEQGPLMTRLAQLTPWYTGWSHGFSLDDQLVGSGFHGREVQHTSGVHTWSGPGSRSVLYVSVPPDERLDLFLDVAGYVDPRVRESLRVRVDGLEAPLVRRPAADVAERIWIRAATSRPYAKLEILVDRSYSPDELGTGPGDLRQVGLALRGYGYRIVPATDRGGESCGDLPEGVNAAAGRERERHPDHAWAVDFVRAAIATDRTEDDVLALMTYGIGSRELESEVTLAGIEEAFRRVLRRPPPQEWIDFWVGTPSKPLRRLYEDLIRGEEFRRLRQRLS